MATLYQLPNAQRLQMVAAASNNRYNRYNGNGNQQNYDYYDYYDYGSGNQNQQQYNRQRQQQSYRNFRQNGNNNNPGINRRNGLAGLLGAASGGYGSYSSGYDECDNGISIGLLLTAALGIAVMFYTLYTKITMAGRRRKKRSDEIAEDVNPIPFVLSNILDFVFSGKYLHLL